MNILCIYIDECDCNNNAILIGVVAGVDCAVIIIVVITNIIVWIYCFRKKHHTGIHACVYTYVCIIHICSYTPL